MGPLHAIEAYAAADCVQPPLNLVRTALLRSATVVVEEQHVHRMCSGLLLACITTSSVSL